MSKRYRAAASRLRAGLAELKPKPKPDRGSGPCCTRQVGGMTVQAMHGADPDCRRRL